ncbi:MAG: hypothetical protein J6Y78_06170 [Paludibacteraceae bacterium]|nr:hypothetical protein [Paludibacteraceae bacterium]
MKRVINESQLRTIINNCVQLVKEAYGSYTSINGYFVFDIEDLLDELIQAGLIPEGENTELKQLFSQILIEEVSGVRTIGEEFDGAYDEIEPDYDSFRNVIANVQNASHPLLTNEAKQLAIQYLKDYFEKYCEDERAYEWQEDYDEPDY